MPDPTRPVDVERGLTVADAIPKQGGVRLSVLVVGTDDWAIEQGAGSLVAAGHQPLRCHEPGEPAFPCNALIAGRTCPLDTGFDVVVTVRGRPAAQPAPAEFGVVCAVRTGHPLVVAGLTTGNPFGPWADHIVTSDGD
ncbi:MAG TPA: hypothetical protein VGI06_07215, partial [Acidimicrobiales bacterium]